MGRWKQFIILDYPAKLRWVGRAGILFGGNAQMWDRLIYIALKLFPSSRKAVSRSRLRFPGIINYTCTPIDIRSFR